LERRNELQKRGVEMNSRREEKRGDDRKERDNKIK